MTARGVLVELFECLGGLKHLEDARLGGNKPRQLFVESERNGTLEPLRVGQNSKKLSAPSSIPGLPTFH